MKVVFALLAEAINRTESGTMNILGEFNTLFSPTFPVVRPSMAGFIRLEGEAGDPASVQLRADIVSEDGATMLWEFQPIAIPITPPRRADVTFNAVGVALPAPGRYRLRVFLDGVEGYSVSLRIAEQPAAVPTD